MPSKVIAINDNDPSMMLRLIDMDSDLGKSNRLLF